MGDTVAQPIIIGVENRYRNKSTTVNRSEMTILESYVMLTIVIAAFLIITVTILSSRARGRAKCECVSHMHAVSEQNRVMHKMRIN